MPKGILDGPKRSLTLETTDQLQDATAFGAIVMGYHNGAAVRIRDIGRVLDGVEDIHQAAWLGDKRVVIIDVHKQPGYNINETVERVQGGAAGVAPDPAAVGGAARARRPHPDHPRFRRGGTG